MSREEETPPSPPCVLSSWKSHPGACSHVSNPLVLSLGCSLESPGTFTKCSYLGFTTSSRFRLNYSDLCPGYQGYSLDDTSIFSFLYSVTSSNCSIPYYGGRYYTWKPCNFGEISGRKLVASVQRSVQLKFSWRDKPWRSVYLSKYRLVSGKYASVAFPCH